MRVTVSVLAPVAKFVSTRAASKSGSAHVSKQNLRNSGGSGRERAIAFIEGGARRRRDGDGLLIVTQLGETPTYFGSYSQ